MAEKVKACIQASKYLDENSRYEMLDVLTHLEGELQAKDVTIAALKSECLKHVIYSIQASNKSGDILTDPLFALGRDAVNVASGPIPPNQSSSSSKNQSNIKDATSSGSLQAVLNKESDAVSQHVAHKIKVLQTLVDAQKSALKKLTTCLREAESQKAELTKDLEDQKRKLEQEVSKNEAALNSSKLDQNPSSANQDAVKSNEERIKLESQIEELQKKLSEEATAKKQITLLLLEDRKKMATLYLEEKKRSEDLNHLLREEKSKVHSLGIGLEEESQRSLAMEAELERYLVQINGQAEELAAARATRQDLEEALRRARADSDHFKKQLTEAHRVAMSQASVAASLVPVMPHNPAQAFSDGSSTLSNMDGNNPSSSSGSYGKWNVSSSATLPSSSAGVLASSSATSAAATLAVGSMTLGSTSQHQSAQSKGVAAVYDKEGHIMGSRQTQEYSSSATMVPRQHRTGIGGLNTSGQPGSSSSGSKSDMSSSSMASSSSVLSGDSMSSSGSSAGVSSSTMSSGSTSGRIINISSNKLSGPPSSLNNSSSGTKGGSSSIMHNVISSGGVGIGKLSVSSSSLKASASSSTSSSIGNKGMPPPIPPNKPAMSALYKPITTALKSIGGGGGAGGNDHSQAAGMTVGDSKNN